MHLRAIPIALAVVGVLAGCTQQGEGPAPPGEAPPAEPPEKVGDEMVQSNPRRYRNNSVMGRITADGKAVAGSTVSVVGRDLTFPAGDDGFYQFVLDPDELGTNTHELRYSAPGCQDHTETVTIPRNNRVKVDVKLER